MSTSEELSAALTHARKVARDEGIDRILKEYDIDAIIGPAESAMPTIACASGEQFPEELGRKEPLISETNRRLPDRWNATGIS